MPRPTCGIDPPEPSLRQWSSADGAAGGWPPLAGDVWDRALQRLLVAAEHPDFSVLHLVAEGCELVVRRAVGGFPDERQARQYAVENGWGNFAAMPTHQVPGEPRPGDF